MVSRGFSTLLLAPRPGCWLSFSPPVPSFSLPQPVVRSATSSAPLSRPLGFPFAVPFAPRWWLLWRWLQILRLGCLLPFLAPFVLPLTSCVFLLFALFSRLLAIRSLLLLLVHALCSSSLSGVSSTFVSLAWFERGHSSLSASLFLFASLLPGGILEFSFAFSHYPVFCCSYGFAGFCLFCPPPFAGHVRPTSASLSLLLGLLFHGPALVGSSFQALSESLSPARWLLVSSFWGFSSFRLCSFCRYAASSCVACSCRFSLLLSLLLVSLAYWRLLWFAPSRGLQCML